MQSTYTGRWCKKILHLFAFFIFINAGEAQTIKLHYSGKKQKIKEAVDEANRILATPEFYNRIDTIQRLSNTSYSGRQIANEMRNLNRTIEVDDYWHPFSKANAGTVETINMNTAKLKRSKASIVNTIIHETVHAVDWWVNEDWNYTHDGNAPDGQEQTAPWVIGEIGESMVSQ